jgi:tetratricopeptide (TPR) repeat protein
MKAAIFFIFLLFLNCNKAEELAKEGHFHLNNERYISALTLFEQALAEDKDNGLALLGKGICLLQSELTLSIGESLIKRSVSRLEEPAHKLNAYMKLSEAMQQSNNKQKAHAYLLKAYADGLSSEAFFVEFARSFYAKQDTSGFLQTLENGLKTFPQSKILRYHSAIALAFYNKDYGKSAERLNELPSDFFDEAAKRFNQILIIKKAGMEKEFNILLDKMKKEEDVVYRELVNLVELESKRRRPSWEVAINF